MLMNILIWTIIGLLGVIGGFLIFSQIDMYRPPEIQTIYPLEPVNGLSASSQTTFSILTWNIGYAGLDMREDFFMDGGAMSMPLNKSIVMGNMKEILKILEAHKTSFVFLQEVDYNASRSYGINEVDEIANKFSNYATYFATNYNVSFVPVPLTHPMGKVQSGLMTLSSYVSYDAQRYAFPGDLPWPTNLFELKRCFLVNKYKINGSKNSLILVNLHLSAFDEGGKLRTIELEYLKNFMIKEYEAGNYVIVGGDWNNMMLGISKTHFRFTTPEKYLGYYVNLPEEWTPENWKWGFDSNVPTNRSNEKPFIKGENFETIIDGFLVSPNVKIVSVKGYDLGFESSDHNPVKIELKIDNDNVE